MHARFFLMLGKKRACIFPPPPQEEERLNRSPSLVSSHLPYALPRPLRSSMCIHVQDDTTLFVNLQENSAVVTIDTTKTGSDLQVRGQDDRQTGQPVAIFPTCSPTNASP